MNPALVEQSCEPDEEFDFDFDWDASAADLLERAQGWSNIEHYHAGTVLYSIAAETSTEPWIPSIGKDLVDGLTLQRVRAYGGSGIHHFVTPRALRGTTENLTAVFNELADRWESETALISMTTQKATHLAYQQIIGMGPVAVPLILSRLREQHRQWFWALTAITREDPAEGTTTVDAAAEAWIAWGIERGFLE